MSKQADDDVVITPRNPETLHNFGPASTRDNIVYTSERPGGDPQGENAKIPAATVIEWITFMKEQHGIQHVMILLDDNELEIYEEPGLLSLYQEHGMTVHRNPMGVPGSCTNAEKILKDIEAAKGKVVAHCTHGMGRSGRIAAAWLVMKYGLSPQEATAEAVELARKNGQERMGNVKALEKWLNNK